MARMHTRYRLTQYAHGGGCACKIPPGELETLVRGLIVEPSDDLLVGLDAGDDAAVVRIENGRALVLTTDFFTPVVDDAYDWGRIAAANALSDVYAMGGMPVVAVNLLSWPARCCAGAWPSPTRPAAISPVGTASTTRSRNTASRSPVSPTRTG